MADDWYYAQNNERKGPVPFAKLKAMAKSGWLTPDDLVWRSGMADWTPAREADGLFETAIVRTFQQTLAGLTGSAAPVRDEFKRESEQNGTPPGIPEKPSKPAKRQERPQTPQFDWDDIQPRHVLAMCGGFLAALGIAFTAIAQSRLALAFTLSGLFIVVAGLYVEIGRLLGQAVENIGKASKEAADRRLRAKELAVEKQRLELEAARLAQDQAAREAPPATAVLPTSKPPEYAMGGQSSSGQVVVINQPPVQRWSPGLAAVLSFFLPGLGQLYKGQIINGIIWFFMVMCGYAALIVPGLVLHFFCVLGALSGNPWSEGKTMVVRQ
jgi:TM2 domain-containing membrane protein YozV